MDEESDKDGTEEEDGDDLFNPEELVSPRTPVSRVRATEPQFSPTATQEQSQIVPEIGSPVRKNAVFFTVFAFKFDFFNFFLCTNC